MDLSKVYQRRFQDISQSKKDIAWKEISKFMYFNMMGKPLKVLDPCAGRCEFINHVSQYAQEVWAVDLQDSANQYKLPKVKTIIGDVLTVDLPEHYFDAIFISNFLEHLESPEIASQFLKKMHKVLAPGGKLVIMGPNFKYCMKQYFDCIDHRFILTHVSVAELLYSVDFKVTKNHPKFLPFSFRGILPSTGFLTKCYLHSPWAWAFLGKQFLIVATK